MSVRAAALASLLVAACAVQPVSETRLDDALAARVDTELLRRGLGRDALSVIDNFLRHEGPPPRAAPPLARELLARPLATVDAASLFNRAVPDGVRRIAVMPAPRPDRAGTGNAATIEVSELLAGYLEDLAEAQRLLREAAPGIALDGEAIVRQVSERGVPADVLRRLATAVEPAPLDRATFAFIDATARFIHALIERGAFVRFPEAALRFDSPVGTVSIGTRGDDVHGPDAAIIIDPGGNDSYERAPAVSGAISVIIDLGGDDRYHGVDLAVQGLSAIVDFSGNDRYTMSGPGLGAAILGASLIADFAGDDAYEATRFAEGAAAYGVGAIIDLAGNDGYRVRNSGQGYAMARGLGLLWDRGGDDSYAAAGGARDAFDRGGGISMAQGAAQGLRTSLGGGVGMLRDDAGNDAYEAEMFAQGVGYYYGVGVLWDRAGDDRYRAVRYAQGNGVHEAVGLLRDESGDDGYVLTFGVGQGMGLDLAVGILFDAAGNDRYDAQVLAQGAATANGVGMVIDSGGADAWTMGGDPRSWGRAEWARGLPSLGVLLYDPAAARFAREGKPVPQPAGGGGPEEAQENAPAGSEPPAPLRCAPVASDAADTPLSLAEALRRIETGFSGGTADPAVYAAVQRRLMTRLDESLTGLPHDDFSVIWSLSMALRCAFVRATGDDAQSMWNAAERVLAEGLAVPLAGPIADAMRARPPSLAQAQRILQALDRHPWCSVRASALRLRQTGVEDGASRAAAVETAQAALRSPCWRLQAAGLRVLGDAGVAPQFDDSVASFLRSDGARRAP